jgi:hypothetical protein
MEWRNGVNTPFFLYELIEIKDFDVEMLDEVVESIGLLLFGGQHQI